MGRKILIIRHKSVGCTHNMLALAKGLATQNVHSHADIADDVTLLSLTLRNKMLGYLVVLLIRCAGILPYHLVRRYFAPLLFIGKLPETLDYDVLISTLGQGEAAGALLLAYHPAAVHLHIGTPRRLPRRYFDVVIANFGVKPLADEIVLSQALTRLDRQDNETALSEFRTAYNVPQNVAALLVGGQATGVDFDDAYWNDLLAFLPNYAALNNMRWLVTTSPRTPDHVVHVLQRCIHDGADWLVHYSHYAGQGKSFLHEYLGCSQCVFVTAESVSMIADAMAYPVPVYVLANRNAIRNKRIKGFLDIQRQHHTIHELDIGDIQGGNVPVYAGLVERPQWTDSFREQLTRLYPKAAERLKIYANSCDR